MTGLIIIAGVVLILLTGCFCCLFCMGATRARRSGRPIPSSSSEKTESTQPRRNVLSLSGNSTEDGDRLP